MICAATPSAAPAQSVGFDPEIQRVFIAGMTAYADHDYRSAEATFRRILDRDPALLRVRLELARTLFMEKKDEQADYQFRLAAAAHPGAMVAKNIVRFREALRARRSWRFNVDFGFAPDSNINSATDKQSVDIYGLPFRLNSDARAHSGTGLFFGGDASIRLNRDRLPIYIGGYGHWVRYSDHRFDDAYVGGEVGPGIRSCRRTVADDRDRARSLVWRKAAGEELRRSLHLRKAAWKSVDAGRRAPRSPQ